MSRTSRVARMERQRNAGHVFAASSVPDCASLIRATQTFLSRTSAFSARRSGIQGQGFGGRGFLSGPSIYAASRARSANWASKAGTSLSGFGLL